MTAGGVRRGVVLDIRAVAEPGPDGQPILVVAGYVVGRQRGRLLGYEWQRERGPALLASVMAWVHRHARYAPAGDVDIHGDGLHLHGRWEDLPTLHEAAEQGG